MTDQPDFDMALSFAGEHRNYVSLVAAGLRRRGYKVFYDEFERVNLLGQELITYLQGVYGARSATVAAFVSEEWVTKPWTGHERQTALAHALLKEVGAAPFLLPLRFDDTPVPGLQPTIAYEDLRHLKGQERRWRADPRFKHPGYIVDLLAAVLSSRGVEPGQTVQEGDDPEGGVRALVVWTASDGGRSSQGMVPSLDLEDGFTDIFEDEVQSSGPPAGRYQLLPARQGVPVNPNDGLPVFLLDTLEAFEKTWIKPLGPGDSEAATADEVRRSVIELVEQEIAHGAASIGPTFTQTVMTPIGQAVVGMCVMARRK